MMKCLGPWQRVGRRWEVGHWGNGLGRVGWAWLL